MQRNRGNEEEGDEHRQIRFDYRKPAQKTEQSRRVHPYHLICDDNRWYMLGYDIKRQAIRTFALGRMSSTILEKQTFEVPTDFEIRDYLQGSMTVLRGPGDYRVVIELDEWITDIERGRRWPEGTVFTEIPGGARLELRVNNLDSISRWVQKWDVHVNVIEPQTLRSLLAERFAILSQRYIDVNGIT